MRAVLGAVVQIFEDFRYTDQIEDGDTALLIFEARVGDRELSGVDILRFEPDGKIRELMVMTAPSARSTPSSKAWREARRHDLASITTQRQ